MTKIKLKCIGIARDGGTKTYIELDKYDEANSSMEKAKEAIDNAYYLDGAYGSPTRGKLFSKDPKKGGVELNKNNYEFDD